MSQRPRIAPSDPIVRVCEHKVVSLVTAPPESPSSNYQLPGSDNEMIAAILWALILIPSCRIGPRLGCAPGGVAILPQGSLRAG